MTLRAWALFLGLMDKFCRMLRPSNWTELSCSNCPFDGIPAWPHKIISPCPKILYDVAVDIIGDKTELTRGKKTLGQQLMPSFTLMNCICAVLLPALAGNRHFVSRDLQVQETQESGFLKVLAFWAEVTCLYDARFILKADDDVYLQVDKVPMLLAQWEALEVGETSNKPPV